MIKFGAYNTPEERGIKRFKLINIYGNGKVQINNSNISGFDYSLRKGDSIVVDKSNIDLKPDTYALVETVDNKYLLFKVKSFSGDNFIEDRIELELLEKFRFGNKVATRMINKHLILIVQSHGSDTFSVYDINKKGFIYTSYTDDSIIGPNIHPGKENDIIIHSDRGEYNGEIAYIKDGVLLKVLEGIPGGRRIFSGDDRTDNLRSNKEYVDYTELDWIIHEFTNNYDSEKISNIFNL